MLQAAVCVAAGCSPVVVFVVVASVLPYSPPPDEGSGECIDRSDGRTSPRTTTTTRVVVIVVVVVVIVVMRPTLTPPPSPLLLLLLLLFLLLLLVPLEFGEHAGEAEVPNQRQARGAVGAGGALDVVVAAWEPRRAFLPYERKKDPGSDGWWCGEGSAHSSSGMGVRDWILEKDPEEGRGRVMVTSQTLWPHQSCMGARPSCSS